MRRWGEVVFGGGSLRDGVSRGERGGKMWLGAKKKWEGLVREVFENRREGKERTQEGGGHTVKPPL